MLKLFYKLPNGKTFAHISRSATSTLALHALQQFYPERLAVYLEQSKVSNISPQSFLEEHWANRLPPECLCMVRKPEDRLQSMLARNSHFTEIDVSAVLNMSAKEAIITRPISKQLTILKVLHLAPITNIAENDSTFVLWPDIKEACGLLGLEYDNTIKVNQLTEKAKIRFEGINLFTEWKTLLNDSTQLWETLCLQN